MKALWNLTSEDRIMVLAPHPDDETLAAGGLLQKAVETGAAIRVVFVTGGDNNPWPHRVVERRWQINPADRTRWGARRRGEAYAALACLGVAAERAHFLGYPDQGLSDLLYRGDEEILHTLAAEILQWRPTLLVSPSMLDLHPDHNALAVLLQLASARLTLGDRNFVELQYLVHGDQRRLADLDWHCLPLCPVEQARKREAIRCHASQLVLSRRRLLAFAREAERFLIPATLTADESHHPVRGATVTDRFLRLGISIPRWTDARGSVTLHLVIQGTATRNIGCVVDLPRKSAGVEVRNAVSGAVVTHGRFCGTRQRGEVILPLSSLLAAQRVFIKVERHFGFFDVAGWRECSLSRPCSSGVSFTRPQIRRAQSPLGVCCIIPCYDVATLCEEVIHEAVAYADYVIAVNDGSSDGTFSVLHRAAAEHAGRVSVLSFARNRGKGVALLAGFRYALAQVPFDVLVTLDGDRQHRAADIPRLVNALRTQHAALVVGEREQFAAMPPRSRVGNVLLSRLLRQIYHASPRDTQSGFRAFARGFAKEVVQGIPGGRYETELQMLILALRRQRRVCTVSIPTLYLDGNRSSHFRPLLDSLRVILSLFRWHQRVREAEAQYIEEVTGSNEAR